MAEETAFSLDDLFEGYGRTLLVPSFRERIRTRELAGHFPFSVQNIYRVLLAIAPLLHKAFKLAAETLDLTSALAQERLGSPARSFRTFHVLVVGAFERGLRGSVGRGDLEPLARAFALRANRPLDVPTELGLRLEKVLGVPGTEPLAVARAAVFLREYVDYLFLGQHDHGYVAYPPASTTEGDVVVRLFRGLPPSVTGHATLTVCTRYGAGACGESSYDPMRGDVERLPGPAALLSAAVLPDDGGSPLGSVDVEELVGAVSRDLVRLKESYVDPDMRSGERWVAEMFFGPARALLGDAGVETAPWQAEVTAAVDAAQRATADGTYTDLYLDRLSAAVASFR